MLLSIELVPQTCWCTNVRSIVPQQEWDRLRRITYKRAGYVCEICGDSGLKQGKKHPVECHEIFHYDDEKLTQKLNDLICLCPRCHMVKHMGRSISIGKGDEALAHLATVNGLDEDNANQYIRDAFKIYQLRSNHQWQLDLSVLSEKYEVDESFLTLDN